MEPALDLTQYGIIGVILTALFLAVKTLYKRNELLQDNMAKMITQSVEAMHKFMHVIENNNLVLNELKSLIIKEKRNEQENKRNQQPDDEV